MNKTINERLFEELLRAPHSIKKAMIEAEFGGRVPCGPHGPGPCGPHHGPFGPHHHGPMGPHHHGPHGPGPHDRVPRAPIGPHGPGAHRHGPNPAFARERLLEVIGNYEGGVRQKTLTEELRINPSSVSELISKLEGDGYVKRTVDPSDKRATLITLTEVGEARAAELAGERAERLGKAFETLTDGEKEQLVALLEKLNEREKPAEAE